MYIINEFQTQIKPRIRGHAPNMLLTFPLHMAPCPPPQDGARPSGGGPRWPPHSSLGGGTWGPRSPHHEARSGGKGASGTVWEPTQGDRDPSHALCPRAHPGDGSPPWWMEGGRGSEAFEVWVTHKGCFCHIPPACDTLGCQADIINENLEGSGFGENSFKNVILPRFKMFL